MINTFELKNIFDYLICIDKYIINCHTFIIIEIINDNTYNTIYSDKSLLGLLLYCKNNLDIDYNELEMKLFKYI